jgi:coenzyme F420 hydrogenase subunit beta
MNQALDNLRKVIDNGLCTRCGSCVGLSEGKIQFTDKTGKYLPLIRQKPDNELAEKLWESCSGKQVDFPALEQFVFNDQGDHHQYLGTYRGLYIGFSRDNIIRRKAGSAGIITTTLIWLLNKGLIKGAVVLGMSEAEPWMNKPYIATTPDEIINAAQSKYTISSVNELLPEIKKFKGDLAYVGLPCQVHSIRKMQAAGFPEVKNIKYIIAPFCGLNLHFSSVISFLKAHGEKNYREIKNIQFRHGEWPGNMRIEMKNGKKFQLPKFHANYLIPFHMIKRCIYCIDASNEFTDISVGDAWAPVYEKRGEGFSFVIVRSEKGEKIAQQMVRDGEIDIQPIDIQQAIKMHSHMYDNKKRGAFIRMKRARSAPDYNVSFPENISFNRKLFETALNLIYTILRMKVVIRIFELLPPRTIGIVFDRFKVFWKKLTYSVKRNKL